MIACCHCGTTEQLRPYGPGGAPICFACAQASPERKAETEAAMAAIFNASAAMSDIGAVLLHSESGFHPFTSADAAEIEDRT